MALIAAAPMSDAALAKKNKHKNRHQSRNQQYNPNNFAWRIRNNTGQVVNYQVYSMTRQGHVWPAPTQVWVVAPDGIVHQDPISCEKGEKICYGAWLERDDTRYWGVGKEGKQACTDCCYTCGGNSQVIGLRNGSMSVAQQSAPPAPQPAPVTTAPQVSGPSFDCGKASMDAEREICRSPRLAELDGQAAALFRDLLSRSADKRRARVKKEQHAWLARRNACGSKSNCLIQSYQDRIAEFQNATQPGNAPPQVTPPAAPPPQLSCTNTVAASRRVAKSMRVDLTAPSTLSAGDKITVRWSGGSAVDAPTYLVVDAPAEVRFAGTGFVPLTPGARAPFNLKHASGRTRAFVPLHRGDLAASGSFSVLPERAGSQEIGWAIVGAGRCGETVLAQGTPSEFTVGLGVPKMVIQDRFAEDRPQKRVRHSSGRYDLLVFKGRYEVRDAETDELVLARAGIDPNFSPTGRFVAARREVDNNIEVLDLVSGDLVETFDSGMLAWALNDSIAIFSASQYGTAGYALTLGGDTGATPPSAENYSGGSASMTAMPKPYRCWQGCEIVLDIDRGFMAVISSQNFAARDLATRQQDEMEISPASFIDASEAVDASSRDQAYQRIRQLYGSDVSLTPGRWAIGERIVLSHDEGLADYNHSQGKFVARYPDVKTGVKVASAASGKGGVLRGTPLDRRLQVEPAKTTSASYDLLFNRIAAELDVTFDFVEKVTQQAFDPNSYAGVPGGSDKVAAARARAKAKALTDRISDENPAFAKVLSEDDGACQHTSAEGLDAAYIKRALTWRGQLGPVHLLETECFGGTMHLQYGTMVLVSSRALANLDDRLLPDDTGGGGESPIGFTDAETSKLDVFPADGGAFLVAASGTATAALIDEGTGSRVGALIRLSNAGLLRGLRVTADKRYVVQLNDDRSFFVYRIADGELLLQGADVDDEIIVMTPDGRYDTSYEGAEALQVSFAGLAGLKTIHQFESALKRPGLAADVLAGRPVTSRPASIGVPPTLEFELDSRPDNGRLRGKVKAQSSAGLKTLRIHLDGKLIEEKTLSGETQEVPFDIADPGGGRWVTAVAFDQDDLASRPKTVPLPGSVRPSGTLRAVLVGIGDYQDPTIEKLNSPPLDARALQQALETDKGRVFAGVSTKTLIDKDATADAILTNVREVAEATGPDDTAVFFFAGHGVDIGTQGGGKELLLVLADSERKAIEETQQSALPWSQVADAVSKARGKVLVILDACNSGAAGKEAYATSDAVVEALFTASGAPMVILAASKGRQLSNEVETGGLFTSTLAAAITAKRSATDRDGNGVIDLAELYRAVKAPVAAEAHRIAVQQNDPDHEQTPWLARNTLVGEMSLF